MITCHIFLSFLLVYVISGKVKDDDRIPESRLIVRYRSREKHVPTSELHERVARLPSIPGVVKVETLLHLDMAIVVAESEDHEEHLIQAISAQDGVEVVVPDTWVYLDSTGMLQEKVSNANPSSSLCSDHPRCATLSLNGACCPATDGMRLVCCEAPVGGGVRVLASPSPLISLQTFHGGFVASAPGGKIWQSSDRFYNHTLWSFILNPDESYSLRNQLGYYLSCYAIGSVRADQPDVSSISKFKVEFNKDSTISLICHHGRYLTAEILGELKATREEADDWERFTVQTMQGDNQLIPNDDGFGQLWGMSNFGHHDIEAVEGWNVFSGETSKPIIVAVIDTGIDYNHPDLKDQMWVNSGEIPGNGIDDDGNGIVDDIHGVDFANDDGDPMDDQEHGTHCAGTIAGFGNNTIGVAGVAWRGVRLMACKFLTSTGGGRSSDAVRAVNYAVAMGAKIASNSWGGGGSSSAMRAAIDRSAKAGVLFVAAAGNDGTNNDEQPHYPSNYPSASIIAVASTTKSGPLSSFSCFGRETVDVAAPGSNIYSTIPLGMYATLSGTSMATPHVTGLAALVWLYRPNLAMYQVKDIILGSVVQEESLREATITGGRINVRRALLLAAKFEGPKPPRHTASKVMFKDTDPTVGLIAGDIIITAADDESDIGYYAVYFISSAGFLLDCIGRVNATSATQLVVSTNGSIPIPEFVTGLAVVSGNSNSESSPGAARLTLQDYGIPDTSAQSLVWLGDSDGRQDVVAGNLQFQRAHTERTVSTYNFYWTDFSGQRLPDLPIIGSVKAEGFMAPTCSGAACGIFDQINVSSGVYRYSHEPYDNAESFVVTFSGPAEVIITSFSTERSFDTLKVGSETLSGQIQLPMTLKLDSGINTIVWDSDFSESGSGWIFEIHQFRATATFEVPAGPLKAQHIEVVTAFYSSEYLEGVSAEISDFVASSMPPSAAFKPKSVAFKDDDVSEHRIEGFITLEPSEAAQTSRNIVTYYELFLGNATGHQILDTTWLLQVSDATATSLRLFINSFVLPAAASMFIVRAGNALGVADPVLYPIHDRVLSPPSGASLTKDEDAYEGQYKGNLTILPAETTTGILWYMVYVSNGTSKLDFVTRIRPMGAHQIVHQVVAYLDPGLGLLVVSAYEDEEMDVGFYIQFTDYVNETETKIHRNTFGLANLGRHLEEEQTIREFWLRPKLGLKTADLQPLWQADHITQVSFLNFAVDTDAAIDTLSQLNTRIICALTIPGLLNSSIQAPTTQQRIAILDALTSALPGMSHEQIRLLKGEALVGSKLLHDMRPNSGSGRRLQTHLRQSLSEQSTSLVVRFEILESWIGALSDSSKTSLDQVESALILLSRGGDAAKRFDADLVLRLRAAGASVADDLRTIVSEPQQVSPKDRAPLHSFIHAGRSLALVSDAEDEDIRLDEEAQEQAGAAAASALGVICGVAVLGCAVGLYIRQRRERTLGKAACCEARHTEDDQQISVEVMSQEGR